MNQNILVILFIIHYSCNTFAARVSLSKALANGWVKAEIRGKKYNEFGIDTNTYQKSMVIDLQNISTSHLEIIVENGRILDSEAQNHQDMMVVQEEIYALKPNEKMKKNIYAMCIQKNNSGPGDGIMYKLGNIAKPDLLSISSYIQENKYFNYGAQNAVWCISDNLSVIHIYEDNPKIEDDLITKICSIKKIPKPDIISLRKQQNGNGLTKNFIVIKKHKFRFKYALNKVSNVKIALFDETDKEVRVLKNSPNKPDGNYELDITFNNVGLPDSIYNIRLIIDNEIRKKAVVKNK